MHLPSCYWKCVVKGTLQNNMQTGALAPVVRFQISPENDEGIAVVQRNTHLVFVRSPRLLALSLLVIPLLTWPIIQIAGDRGVFSFFAYIFLVWAGIVFLLARLAATISRSVSSNDDACAEIANKDQQG